VLDGWVCLARGAEPVSPEGMDALGATTGGDRAVIPAARRFV
jgi:hypothetical protein